MARDLAQTKLGIDSALASLAGTLHASAGVPGGGCRRVEDTNLEPLDDGIGNAALQLCILSRVEGWKFPAIPDGTVRFTLPRLHPTSRRGALRPRERGALRVGKSHGTSLTPASNPRQTGSVNRDATIAGSAPREPGPGAVAKPRASGFSHLVLHLHPRVVPLQALRWTRTFGLGGLSVVLVLLLTLTGVLLLFVYEPATERAYDSVRAIHNEVLLGGFVRNLHRGAADLAIVLVFLHLARVVFTGAFRGPRATNWILGLCLFALILASNFTGYLLPWDQTAYWAVTICTSMLDYVPLIGAPLQGLLRGGPEVGSRTLSTFFVLHIVFVPVALGFLVLFHFWLVRKAGGIVLPCVAGEASERGPLVPVSPHLTTREGAAALVLLAGLCVYALVFDAPLGARANPGLSPNPAKAPWYFAGAQELLMHVHPWVAVCLVPLAVAVFLVTLPRWGSQTRREGVWFLSATGRRMAGAAALWGAALALCGIAFDAGRLGFQRGLPGLPAFVTAGVLPLGLLGLVAAGILVLLRRRLHADVHETLQGVVAGMMAALLVLTIAGAVFRGPGMKLVWPGHAAVAVDGVPAGEN